MKLLYSLFVAAFMLVSFSADAQKGLTVNNNVITVVIDGTTSRKDLLNLRTALENEGIDFRYSMQFNNETKITSVDFTVSADNGAITGSGSHEALQNPNANVTFKVNKANGTYNVEIKE